MQTKSLVFVCVWPCGRVHVRGVSEMGMRRLPKISDLIDRKNFFFGFFFRSDRSILEAFPLVN